MKTPPVLCAAILLLATAHGETSLVEAGRFIHLHDVEEGLEPRDTYVRAEAIDAVSVSRSGNKGDQAVPFKVWITTRMVTSGGRSNPEGWATESKGYHVDCASREEAEKVAAAILKACSGGEMKMIETVPEKPVTPAEVVINVQADGQLEGGMLSHADLASSLKALAALYPDQPVRIRADQETKYQDVARVIELCQKAGITNISFAAGKGRGEQAAPSGDDKPEK